MAGPDSGAPARELGETAAKSRLQQPLPPWLNLEAQGLAKLVGTADVKDKGTSGAVSKNRMHAAHEQTLEPSSTSDQDQEHNQRECKNQICSPQSCSNRSNPCGAVREREREPREEREGERALAAENFHALSRAANALTHACLLQRECRVLIDKLPASGNLTW